jgi:hypothetical protein
MSLNSISLLWAGYNIIKALTKAEAEGVSTPTSKTWRPPQWQGLTTDQDQLIYIKTNIGGYFFDAFLREEHTTTLKITEHPVQTGANIVDHAYMEPARLVMDIGMSDAMESLVTDQFSGGYTKSVQAYQTLLELQKTRLPLQVFTRLNLYQNMVIESLNSQEDFKTLYGLRCTVTLREIMVVEVTTTTVSAREQTSGTTSTGTVQPTEPTSTIAAAFEDATGG